MTRVPADDYKAVLRTVHALLRPRTYLEIGIRDGSSFALMEPETIGLGIDPRPTVTIPVNSSAAIFCETSDEFFAHRDPRLILGGEVDLAFVDGMHLFEFALRDFRNLERACSEKSIVILHDTIPPNKAAAGREATAGHWTGDVWRLILCLREQRPDLRIDTLAVPPSGLTFVQNLDPTNTIMFDRYEGLIRKYLALDYTEIVDRRDEALGVVAYEGQDWTRLLQKNPFLPVGTGQASPRRLPRSPRLIWLRWRNRLPNLLPWRLPAAVRRTRARRRSLRASVMRIKPQ